MRALFPSLLAVLFTLLCVPFVRAQTTVPAAFPANLSLGSSGTQVVALQKVLNQDPDTRIADTGPGSPGNETSRFGPLTKAAVVRFQEKYAKEVLAPAGLTHGNGFMGFYTRVKLNALSASAKSEGSMSPSVTPSAITPTTTTTPVTVSPSAPPVSVTASQNPNLKNVDTFFAALDNVATKQGYTPAQIAEMKQHALEVLATTTDLRAAFLKTVQDKSHQPIADNSFGGKIVATIARTFDKIFMPEHARAAVGVPFGGALLFAVPCDGGVWNITLSPLPPAFPVLLAYETGSQAFLSYNIPATSWLLGEYEPVPMAYCWVGIYPYPSEGLITPMTGSSPL